MPPSVISRILQALSLPLFCLSGTAVIPARAQSSATAPIMGRIFNPATREYVRDADVTIPGPCLFGVLWQFGVKGEF